MSIKNLFLQNCSLKLFKVWLVGYVIGIFLAVSLFIFQEGRFFWEEPVQSFFSEQDELIRERNLWIASEDDDSYVPPIPPEIRKIDYLVHKDKYEDRTVSKAVSKKVRVFCMVMTEPERLQTRCRTSKDTWGNRCDKLLFFNSENFDEYLPAVALRTENEDDIWTRDVQAFQYVYLNHRDEAEWFIKTDDNTYVIMENLKYMLLNYNSSEAVYFGCEEGNQTCLSKTGFVFSKEALKLFSQGAIFCNNNLESPDIVMENCLRGLNIRKMDSRDAQNRSRFFPYSPPYLGLSHGASDYAISFHKIIHNYQYLMEYFVYHLRGYGIVAKYQPPEVIEGK